MSYWLSGKRNPGGWRAKTIEETFAIPMAAWRMNRKRAA